jgi:hypothetical protein
MYTEVLSGPVWELLSTLVSIPDIELCYLGGGTALALQLGHRRSNDLDFVTTGEFSDSSFIRELQYKGLRTVVINQTSQHTELMLESTKVDLIRERIPLNFSLRPIHPRVGNLRMADPRDIGRMKLLSIASRGSRKDFVDLWCLTRQVITLESLVMTALEEDQPVRYSRLLFLKGLVDFEEADRQVDLAMIWDVSWEQVKKSLRGDVKEIARKIGEDS